MDDPDHRKRVPGQDFTGLRLTAFHCRVPTRKPLDLEVKAVLA